MCLLTIRTRSLILTEEKRQSTVQPEQIQGFNSPAEDEIDIIDLLKFLARKKVFILAVTSIFTLSSIFYAQSMIPVYRATVGLLIHKESFSSYSILKQLGLELSDKVFDGMKTKDIFERFLFNIKSYEFKKEVFVNGGFQKKFSRKTGIDTDQSVLTIYDSIKIFYDNKHDNKTQVVSLELEGSKPKVMLEFLTTLVEAAKENVNTEINDITRSLVKTKINNLSAQIEELHQKITVQKPMQEQIEKEEEIARLSKHMDMAKRMGIKNNNFAKEGSYTFPEWFLYGELALQQKIKMLRSKEETPNNKNLSIDKLKLKGFQRKLAETNRKLVDLPLLKLKVVTIGEYSYSLVEPNRPLLIVGLAVALGLLISIYIAVLIDQKQRAKEIPSASI